MSHGKPPPLEVFCGHGDIATETAVPGGRLVHQDEADFEGWHGTTKLNRQFLPLMLMPYWKMAPMPVFGRIESDLEVDVVVVGGGIMGLTAAYLLKKAGRTVAVLERERCGGADTGHTTAHLTAVTDRSRAELTRSLGRDAARAVWDAGCAAIDQIVALTRAEDIACDFRWVPGYLHAPLGGRVEELPEKRRWLEEEARVAREILGLEATFVASLPYFGLPAVKFPQQAIFHPLKYLAGLARRVAGEGSHVFESSEAGEITPDPLTVRSGDHCIRAKHLILATHTPLMGLASVVGAAAFQTKLALYSSYAIGAKIPAGVVPEASFWDTAEPYNYLRVERRDGFDYAILGGEDHKTGQCDDTQAVYRRLEERLLRFMPSAQIDHRWSGQVIDTSDGLPFIGELVTQQFGGTGFAGNGMTFGTLAAMMAADWVLGRKNPWEDLFEPGRKRLIDGAWTYLSENKDYPYFMVRDWLAAAEGASLQELPRGEGKILSLDGRKVAAYRDEGGAVSLCSPVCTHLKCIVHWNTAERTWDCPCHGARFKPTGEVISGPAEEPLEKITRER